MHITIDEAIAILDSWKAGETLLDVHASMLRLRDKVESFKQP